MSGSQDPLVGVISREIAEGAMPAAAWWVGDARGARSRGACGRATIEPQVMAVGEDTPFDLASLTKPLGTALLALLLESEGRLDMGASLGSLFPGLRSSPFGGHTLGDAATHRAGLPAWKPLYLAGGSRDAYLASIAACEAAPLDSTLYSDLGYLLLGFAIEQRSGVSLDRLFDERIGGPLGLTTCGFAGRGSRFSRAAATERGNDYERKLAGALGDSYRFRAGVIRGEVHDGNAWALGGVAGHAGLFGTAADVAAIALAILDPERLGSTAKVLEPMLLPASADPGSRTFGFLLARDSESVRGILPDRAVGHFGFTGTSIWIDVDCARVYVLLTNRVHPVVPTAEFTRTRRGFHVAAVAC